MNHRQIERLLSPYLDEELPEYQLREVTEHLHLCEMCMNHLEELRTIKRDIRAAADVSLGENFAYSVLRSIRNEREHSLMWLGAERFARKVVFGLSLLVICLIGLGILFRPEPPLLVDRIVGVEAADSLMQRMLGHQDEISKDDVVFAALTR